MDGMRKIGIIGLGLIGGSLALALKEKYTVVGCSADDKTVSYAVNNHMIHEAAYSYKQLIGCSAVFICTPIDVVKKTAEDLFAALGDSVIISDVGSVKGMLSDCSGRVIGGHPMAGTEGSGIEAARERLFENAYYILCDYKGNTADLETVKQIVTDAGAKPIVMTPAAHDKLVAKISHLPHMLAYSLVTSAIDGDENIVGSGFMDTTRIASSPPGFWNEVANLNRKNLLEEMDKFSSVFTDLRNEIAAGRDITGFLRDAKIKRDKLTQAKRYMTEYVLYIDVPDRVGSIAAVVSKLAGGGISLENLQVVGSREGAGGALRLEFKSEAALKKAKELLK